MSRAVQSTPRQSWNLVGAWFVWIEKCFMGVGIRPARASSHVPFHTRAQPRNPTSHKVPSFPGPRRQNRRRSALLFARRPRGNEERVLSFQVFTHRKVPAKTRIDEFQTLGRSLISCVQPGGGAALCCPTDLPVRDRRNRKRRPLLHPCESRTSARVLSADFWKTRCVSNNNRWTPAKPSLHPRATPVPRASVTFFGPHKRCAFAVVSACTPHTWVTARGFRRGDLRMFHAVQRFGARRSS